MSDTSPRPDGGRAASEGGRPAGGSGGSSRSGGQNRNRNRNRNRSRSSGGGSRNGSSQASGSRSGGSRSGGARSSGSRNGGSGGGRSSGGTGRGPSDRHAGGNAGRSGNGDRQPVPAAPSPVATAVGPSADSIDEARAVRQNRQRAVVLCLTPGLVAGVVLGIILVAVGLPVVGVAALVVVTVAVALWEWQRAPGVVLRGLGAHPSADEDHPRLHNLVDGLCATMGLSRPAIWVVDSEVPNALSVGLDPARATLVVTSGLDNALTLVELEGVLAHELVHIKRQDTVVAGAAVATTSPLAALRGTVWGVQRVHRLVGRGREFAADQRAAAVVRYPPGIGSALDAMVTRRAAAGAGAWPPGPGRVAALTRWLWIDPMAGAPDGESTEGNLDDTRVRAAAQSLR